MSDVQNEQARKTSSPPEPQGQYSEGGHIAFEGLLNTRDLGYLSTEDGQAIAPQVLLRSGALADASTTDIKVLLETYKLKTVIDLRTDEEKEKAPSPKDKMPGVRFVDAPILGFSTTGITRENGLAGMAKKLSTLKQDPMQIMKDLYPGMVLDETGIKGYRCFFRTLAEDANIGIGKGAVLWHCSAGKDRAGLATVLLLTVLGVAWSDIVSNYEATNLYLKNREDNIKKLIPAPLLSSKIEAGLKTLNSAHKEFLQAGLEAIDEAYGSLDVYLHDALGVDDAMRAELKAKFLLAR